MEIHQNEPDSDMPGTSCEPVRDFRQLLLEVVDWKASMLRQRYSLFGLDAVASSTKPAADINQPPGVRHHVLQSCEGGLASCHAVLDPLDVLASFGHHPFCLAANSNRIKWLQQAWKIEQIVLF